MSRNGPRSHLDSSELRQRLAKQPSVPQHADSENAAHEMVMELNAQEEKLDKHGGERRTYGRTPDGTGALEDLTIPTQIIGSEEQEKLRTEGPFCQLGGNT